LITDTTRHIDLARFSQTFESGGDIDAVSVNISFIDDHITGVNADAELDSPIGLFRFMLCQVALNINAAADGIEGAVELDQHSVAHAADQASMMLGDRGID
jgi:hypothetical protein